MISCVGVGEVNNNALHTGNLSSISSAKMLAMRLELSNKMRMPANMSFRMMKREYDET